MEETPERKRERERKRWRQMDEGEREINYSVKDSVSHWKKKCPNNSISFEVSKKKKKIQLAIKNKQTKRKTKLLIV